MWHGILAGIRFLIIVFLSSVGFIGLLFAVILIAVWMLHYVDEFEDKLIDKKKKRKKK